MLQPYPVADPALDDPAASAEMEWVKQFILGVRKIKGEMNIAPARPVPVLLADATAQDAAWADSARPYLEFLARTESVTLLPPGDAGPEAATALIGKLKILIPLAGLIDKEAELKRLDKEIGRLRGDLSRVEQKLANPNFVDKAPEAVVAKERSRLEGVRSALRDLEQQAAKISAL
jgi:valyl-tRNA synthetase